MPILCVDVILRGPDGRILLVKRNNAPFKNQYWVPGGRVMKGESLEKALARKLKEELGSVRVRNARPVGFYQGTRLDSGFWKVGEMHAVSLVYEADVTVKSVKLDAQSSTWGWFDGLPKRFQINSFGGRAAGGGKA
jgi:colanic acid biosynthesis protein WcaH